MERGGSVGCTGQPRVSISTQWSSTIGAGPRVEPEARSTEHDRSRNLPRPWAGRRALRARIDRPGDCPDSGPPRRCRQPELVGPDAGSRPLLRTGAAPMGARRPPIRGRHVPPRTPGRDGENSGGSFPAKPVRDDRDGPHGGCLLNSHRGQPCPFPSLGDLFPTLVCLSLTAAPAGAQDPLYFIDVPTPGNAVLYSLDLTGTATTVGTLNVQDSGRGILRNPGGPWTRLRSRHTGALGSGRRRLHGDREPLRDR